VGGGAEEAKPGMVGALIIEWAVLTAGCADRLVGPGDHAGRGSHSWATQRFFRWLGAAGWPVLGALRGLWRLAPSTSQEFNGVSFHLAAGLQDEKQKEIARTTPSNTRYHSAEMVLSYPDPFSETC
jgi:hypothetical protein